MVQGDISSIAPLIITAFFISSSKSCHWLFSSQYLKTCILLPSFIRKKKLLLEMYEDKTEEEYHFQPLYGAFMERHDEFEKELAAERKK